MSDDWQVVKYATTFAGLDEQKDAAAALARLREREAQLEREAQRHLDVAGDEFNRAQAAEARVAELAGALREIALGVRTEAALEIARRALAHEEEK